jgi:hypothetical protein
MQKKEEEEEEEKEEEEEEEEEVYLGNIAQFLSLSIQIVRRRRSVFGEHCPIS